MWESFLQNDLLMIALGLLPAACVVIPCLFIRKMYSKTAYMVLTLTLAASIALTTTVGALNLNSISSASEDGKSREAYVPTNAEYLSAFSGFMLAKAYDTEIKIDYNHVDGFNRYPNDLNHGTLKREEVNVFSVHPSGSPRSFLIEYIESLR